MKKGLLYSAALACLVSGVTETAAQQRIGLTQEARFPEGFGLITSVRELPGGGVMVADPLGQLLAVLDIDAGSMQMIGSEGQGPNEYGQPDAVFALPGDSTLLVDLGNGRLTIMDADHRFVRTRPISVGEPNPRSPGAIQMLLPRAVDAEGNIYFSVRAARQPGSQSGGDSSFVARFNLLTEAIDTVARFKPQEITMQRSGGNVQMRLMPMSPQDGWTVAPDGTIVLVRAGEYRVDVVHPDGRIARGAAVDYDPVRPGDAEKIRNREQAANAGIGISVTAGPGGQRSMSFGRGAGGGGGGSNINDLDWPDVMPAFTSGGTRVSPDGRIWVRRNTKVGDLSLYDVFDGDGQKVGETTFEGETAIVGFGAGGAVYTVTTDEFGLQWLVRFRMS